LGDVTLRNSIRQLDNHTQISGKEKPILTQCSTSKTAHLNLKKTVFSVLKIKCFNQAFLR